MISTLGLFISVSLLLAVLMAVLVVLPWLRHTQSHAGGDNRLMALNIEVFHERLAELHADKSEGLIDELHYHSQKTELERQLLDAQQHTQVLRSPSRMSRLIIIIWIPLLAALAYVMVGDRTPVFKLWQAQDQLGQVADDLLTGSIDTPPEWAVQDASALISAMQTNVHHNAHDPQRWMRLSEVFVSLEATDSALEALARAHRLAPTDQDIAATYAQVSFFARGGRLDAEARQVLATLLSQNPDHEGAKMLMAMGEVRAGNFVAAQDWIANLRASIAAKPGDHSAALASLDDLKATVENQQAQAAQGVEVRVSIAQSLLMQIQADDVLFVAIRDIAGGPPVAATRVPASEFRQGQTQVRLSDLDAMLPELTLSNARAEQTQLAVSARISHTGDADAQSGDLTANPVILTQDQTEVSIEINQQIP